jgi:hypothetical protein
VIYGTVGSNNGNLAGWNRGSLSTINRGIGASSRDIIIRKNVLYDNASGVRVYDRYKVYNNTILFNNRDFEGGQSNWRAPGSAQFFGISEREVGTRALGIKNNIVGGHRNTGEVVLRVGGSSQLDINYNLYFNPEKVQIVDFNTSGNWSAFDLDGWRRFLATQRIVLGADNNSLVAADPKLAYGRGVPTGELTRTSFYPTADSPAVARSRWPWKVVPASNCACRMQAISLTAMALSPAIGSR